MKVRIATIADYSVLAAFNIDYMIYQLELQGFKFSQKVFQQQLLLLIQSGSTIVGEVDGRIVGGIGGRIMGSYYSEDVIYDVVTMYIDPDYRQYSAFLLSSLEEILKLTTVTKIVLANPAFADWPKKQRFYKMKGYTMLQSSLVKHIKGDPNAGQSPRDP